MLTRAKGAVEASVEDYQVRLAEYKLDLEAYQRNEEKVRKAIALLAYWVDPSIRGKVLTYKNPKEATDYITSQYKMSSSRALDLALGRKVDASVMWHGSAAGQFGSGTSVLVIQTLLIAWVTERRVIHYSKSATSQASLIWFKSSHQ